MVGGEVWRVDYPARIDRSNSGAVLLPDSSRIRIVRRLSPEAKCKRLAHELAHAAGFSSEAEAEAAEAIIGLLLEHGVIMP
jgi:hypothetical protein